MDRPDFAGGQDFFLRRSRTQGTADRKKATLLLATGGVYAQGSAMAALDFVTPYLRAVLGFLGITDVTVIVAEGTAQLNTGKVDPQTFLALFAGEGARPGQHLKLAEYFLKEK